MKKNLILTVSAITLSVASVASAQSYIYEFTGTSATGAYPANFVDGSTVTISGGTITTYDFMAPGFGNFGTPLTTTVVADNVTSYGPTGWTGELDLNYQGIDLEVTGDSFTSVALGASIQGTWTVVPEPDTFALLGAAVLAVAAGRPLLRRVA